MIVIDSKYRQPFGTFTGSLAGVTLREGYGGWRNTTFVVSGEPTRSRADVAPKRITPSIRYDP